MQSIHENDTRAESVGTLRIHGGPDQPLGFGLIHKVNGNRDDTKAGYRLGDKVVGLPRFNTRLEPSCAFASNVEDVALGCTTTEELGASGQA